MPAYSFKERFVPFVKDGSKQGTIRAFRNQDPKVGQLAHLYYGMRTKYCTKLLEPSPEIKRVVCVVIGPGEIAILNYETLTPFDRHRAMRLLYSRNSSPDYHELSSDERSKLAYMDGFRMDGHRSEWDSMNRFFFKNYAGDVFVGQWIVWGQKGVDFLDRIFPKDAVK